MRVAPSTAVSPAIASTTLPNAPSLRDAPPAAGPRTSSASSVKGGSTAYAMGRTIDSRQASPSAGTIRRVPPRLCVRIDTAIRSSPSPGSSGEADGPGPINRLSVALLALKARPEARIDHCLDRPRVHRWRARRLAWGFRRRAAGEVILQLGGEVPGGGVERGAHRSWEYNGL